MAMMPPPSGVPGGLGLVAPNNLSIASSSSASGAMLSSPSIPPGHATLRLLEYFDALAGKGSLHGQEIHDLSFWRSLTHTFYSPDGVFRLIAWNPSTREQRSFELPTPVIPRYLHTVHLSGVAAHSMSLGQPREWSIDQLSKVPDPPSVKGCSLGSPNNRTTHFIQVDRARMDIEYETGWTVVQKGIIRAAFMPIGGVLKLQFLDFVIQDHYSLVPRSKIQRGVVEQPLSEDVVSKIRGVPAGRKKDSKKGGDGGDDESKPSEEERNRFTQPVERWSMPENPVNEYGMTLRAMRCLEITESVCQLRDLMEFASQHTLGPMQALQRLAGELRASRSGDHQEGGGAGSGQDGGNTSSKRKGGASGEGGAGGAADGNVKTEAGEDELPSRSSPAKRMR